MKYLRKHGGMLPGVAKRVDVPGDTGAAARSKRLIEEPEAHRHLVDDGAVVGGGLVTHAPAAIHKLQTAWRKVGGVFRRVVERSPPSVKAQLFVHVPSSTSCLTVRCMSEPCCFHQR